MCVCIFLMHVFNVFTPKKESDRITVPQRGHGLSKGCGWRPPFPVAVAEWPHGHNVAWNDATKKRDPRTQGYPRAPFFSKSTMIHHDSMISFNTPPHGWYFVYWSDHPPMASFQRDKRGVSICPRHLSLAMHLHVVNLAPVGAIIVTHRAVAPNAGLPSHLTEFNPCPMTHWPPIKKWTMSMSETTKKSRIKHKTAHHPMKYITRCYGYSSKHLPRLYLALFSLVQTPSQMVLGSPG